jgi:phosphatidylserine/phosphatidylglycerophosphate/cardiolipin synthase-like enzyme
MRKAIIIFSLLLCGEVCAEPTTENAFSPRQGATALVIKTIEEAEKTIHVAAYSFTSKPIAEALVAAHGHGIDVEVVLDKSQSKSRYRMLSYLTDNGIPARINSRYAIMHNKFMIIDSKVLELGSFNYTKAAEEKNAENVLVIRRKKRLIKNYEKQWKKLWDEAETAQEINARESVPLTVLDVPR